MRFGKACFEPADGFKNLVAFLESATADAAVQFFEGRGQAAALAAPHGAFFVFAWLAAGQQVMDVAALEQFDLNVGIVGQALPAGTGQFALKFLEGVAACGEQITSAFFVEESERVLIDHAAIQ